MSSFSLVELGALLRLAVPVVTVQIGMMAMGVVDVAMIGRVSSTQLAATALGHVYGFGLLIFGMGVLQSLDPLIAQAVGARDHRAIRRNLQRGIALAALLCIPTSLLAWPAASVLRALGQAENLLGVASGYVHASIPGYLPFLAFIVLRQTLQAFSRIAPIVLTIVFANALNAFLNWLLIYGNLGCPALGAVGSAWATTSCRWLMALLLLAFGWRELKPHLLPLRSDAFRWTPLLRMIRLGAPIGLMFCFEYGAFMTTALLMGRIGTEELAGHQVAINLASLSFMLPMGIGAAAAVRVGHAIGREDAAGTRVAGMTALGLGAVVMLFFGALFLLFPAQLARLYTDQPEVVAMAALLLPVAGLFQVFDGVQAVASGVLRGAGDTVAPMRVHLLGFWGLGVPLGAYLTFGVGVTPTGPWWGLVLGLVAVSLILAQRVHLLLRSPVARVRIDAEEG